MIVPGWRRLGLIWRLALPCAAVLIVLTSVLIASFVRSEVDSHAAESSEHLDTNLTMLVSALSGPAILGDYGAISESLRAFARSTDVERVEWVATRGDPVAVEGPWVPRTAPRWFAQFAELPAAVSKRRIVVGGTDYGEVRLWLDAAPVLNRIWHQVVAGVTTALVGIGAMLAVMLLTVRHGLGSLSRLVSGMRRFEGGDYGIRVEAAGPPEIVSSIDAFNRMAARSGAVFDALRESESRNRRLATIVEQSTESIVTRDLNGVLLSWNKGAERLFGWTAAEAVGKRDTELHMRGSDPVEYERLLPRADDTGSWAVEGPRLTKSGALLHVAATGSPLFDEHGRVIGGIHIARDISELKKAQAMLINAKQELEARVLERTAELALAKEQSEAANRSKSAFLATMSHEIRTPMNGVVGMIDVLEQSHLKSSQAEIVKTIRESAYALLGIVDDVLDFSKIEAGQFEVEHEPMDVCAVAEGACDTLQRLAQAEGVALTLFTDPALPQHALGDAARLRQVLLNLVGNAIKFSGGREQPGRVAMRVVVAERSVERVSLAFTVADNGIGMDAATMARLFAPFTQADASTTRRYGGTGLGLSISHRLVELMGGELGVQSQLEHGSVFTLRLPVAMAPAAEAGHETAALELAGVRCAVVAADDWSGDDFTAWLEHAGAGVERLPGRAAACAWLPRCAPGTWIVLTAGSAPELAATRAQLQAVCRTRSDVALRFVTLETGLHLSHEPLRPLPGMLRGASVHRRVLVAAVARWAGRAPSDLDEPADVDTMPAPLAARDNAIQGSPILIAEDNVINQKVLRQQLALLGFPAHIVGNGLEALECVRRDAYPLLLTDLHMPVMDGYELVGAIRRHEGGDGPSRMPIVALTANALKGEASRCLELGMDDYMTKPVQLANLKAMLRKWMPAVALPTVAEPAPPVDLRVLEALVGSEPAVIAELVADFRVTAAEAVRQMRGARAEADNAAVGEVAHRLKSSARSMGALTLGEACARIELASKSGESDLFSGSLWHRFHSEVGAVDEFLASFQQRSRAALALAG